MSIITLSRWWFFVFVSSTKQALIRYLWLSRNRSFLRNISQCLILLMLLPVHSQAKDEHKILFNIPRLQADVALIKFAEQADVTFIFPYDDARQVVANSLNGIYTAKRAIRLLLRGTDLIPEFRSDGTLAIKSILQSKDEFTLRGNIEMNDKKTRPSFFRRLAAIFTASFSVTVGAQVSDGTEHGAARALIEEIVVTARKKDHGESLQSVPIAISAFSGKQLTAMFAEELRDIGFTLPNVRFQDPGSFPAVSNYTIRGMGLISSIASAEPTVGMTVDGLYLGSNFGGNTDVFDLESVEILRGPQGTLFGRNVTGGAVIVRSARPTGEFDAKLKLGLGSGGRKEVSASLQDGFNDKLAGKIFVAYKDRDGDFTNLVTNDDFGQETSKFVRPILKWMLSDTLEVSLIAEHGEIEGDGGATRLIDDPTKLPSFPVAFGGFGYTPPPGKTTLALNGNTEFDVEWDQLISEVNWVLDAGTLTSVTGYRDVTYRSSLDLDGTPFTILNNDVNDIDHQQFSQELRFSGEVNGGKTEYTIGAYYIQQELEQRTIVTLFGGPFGNTIGSIDHTSYALFLHTDTQLNDQLSLTLALRYSDEKKQAVIGNGNQCDTSFNCSSLFKDEKSWDNLSPKIGLSWQLSDDVLTYASWTQGFRSGGYNVRNLNSASSPGPYDEEQVDAFELGLKSEFWNGRGRFNAALFSNDFDDLQRTVISLDPSKGQTVENAASGTIKGFELELVILPLDNLAFTASIGYLDAAFDEFLGLDVNGDGVPDPALAKNLELTRVPEFTYSTSVTYDADLGNLGLLTLRAAYSFTDEQPANDANTFYLDEYKLVDASASLTTGKDDRLKISLYCRNLTNEVYADTAVDLVPLFSTQYQNLPRHYGVEVSYNF